MPMRKPEKRIRYLDGEFRIGIPYTEKDTKTKYLEPLRRIFGTRMRYDRDWEEVCVKLDGMTYFRLMDFCREKDYKYDLDTVGEFDNILFPPPIEVASSVSRFLYQFQAAAVMWAIGASRDGRGIIIADEIGSGKSLEALAVMETLKAKTVIIVCPASIKINWQREIKKWLPSKTTIIVNGRSNPTIEDANFVIVNYDIVHHNLDALRAVGADAIVFDEFHMLRRFSARWTRACNMLVCASLPIGLTGTPVVNRPGELWPQLVILDRTFCSFDEYYERFCVPEEADLVGLREAIKPFFLRRIKSEIMADLPALTWAPLYVEIDNRDEYEALREEFEGWVYSNRRSLFPFAAGKDGTLTSELSQNYLGYFSRMRRIISEGKASVTVEWITNFLESEEKLVVFAHHQGLQQHIAKNFPDCAKIAGGDRIDERDANVQRFRGDPDCRLIVCSLKGAQAGLDGLQDAAANCLLVEGDWTPSGNDQAAGRISRQGQGKPCTAWLMVARDTLDEHLMQIVDRKRGIVDTIVGDTEKGVQRELLMVLLGKSGMKGEN